MATMAASSLTIQHQRVSICCECIRRGEAAAGRRPALGFWPDWNLNQPGVGATTLGDELKNETTPITASNNPASVKYDSATFASKAHPLLISTNSPRISTHSSPWHG